MEVTYIYHSGFMVETPYEYLIFDYYKGDILIPDKSKAVYFFSSHNHPDHFKPEIFEYNDTNVKYILAKDNEKKINYHGMLEPYPKIDLTYVVPDENYIFAGGEIQVKTYKSTDRGVAFMVNVRGENVFHAGDLNAWLLPNQEKAKRNDMLARFKRIIEGMKDLSVKAAFIPLDPRLGEDYATGFDMYCKCMNIENIFPMHMWEEYEYITRLKNSNCDYKDRIMVIKNNGDKFKI